MRTTHIAIGTVLTACLSLLFAGCSHKYEAPVEYHPAWQKNIIAGTDFLMVIDMPELKKLGLQPQDEMQPDPIQEQIKAEAGFSQDDVSTILITSDIDAMPPLENFKALAAAAPSDSQSAAPLQTLSVTGINVHVFLVLDVPIKWNQLTKAAKIIFADQPSASLQEFSEQQRLLVTQKTSAVPLWISLIENGNTIHLSTSDASPDEQPQNNDTSAICHEEELVHNKGPIRVAVRFSEKMSQKMKEGIDATKKGGDDDTMAVALGSIAESFQSFKGFGIALTPGNNGATVYGSFELGSEEAAIYAEGLIQSTLIPLIMMTIPQEDEDAPPLLQNTKTKVRGPRIILDTVIAAQSVDLEELTKKED